MTNILKKLWVNIKAIFHPQMNDWTECADNESESVIYGDKLALVKNNSLCMYRDLMRSGIDYTSFNNIGFGFCDISWSRIKDAVLSDCDFSYCSFLNTNFHRVKFINCRFWECDLNRGVISDCKFENCLFESCNFQFSNITTNNFTNTRIIFCDFYDATLQGREQNLYLESGFVNACSNIDSAIPDGSIIGYKVAFDKTSDVTADAEDAFVLVKLLIPEDAKRSNATTNKCRCDKASVLSMEYVSGKPLRDKAIVTSNHDTKFIYEVGETIRANDFDDNRFNECSGGIHFFLHSKDAITYFKDNYCDRY